MVVASYCRHYTEMSTITVFFFDDSSANIANAGCFLELNTTSVDNKFFLKIWGCNLLFWL